MSRVSQQSFEIVRGNGGAHHHHHGGHHAHVGRALPDAEVFCLKPRE